MVSPEVLRQYRYFTAGGEDALKDIASIANERRVEAGEALFREGDSADNLYVVTHGEIEVALELASGQSEPVATMVAGDLVGWSALAEQGRRRAHCTARKPTTVVGIDGPELRALCQDNTDLGYRLMSELFRALTRRLDGAWVQLAASDSGSQG